MEMNVYDPVPFVDLSKKRPCHSVSLNSEISNSLGAVSVLNETESAACSNMSRTSLVDLTNENSNLQGSSVNINLSLSTSAKNKPFLRVASVYAKRAR